MIQILIILAPIFMTLGLGAWMRHLGLFPESYVDQSNRLIFCVFLPLLLFHKISQSDVLNTINGMTVGVMAASITGIYLLSRLWGILARYPAAVGNTFVNNNFRGNFVYIGLPVCYYALGDSGMAIASVLTALAVPMVNILSVLAFGSGSGQKFRPDSFVIDTLKNPLIIGAMAGVVSSLLGIAVPLIIKNALALVTQITLPLALCCIGATLQFGSIVGRIPTIVFSSIFKLFLLPLTAALMMRSGGHPLGAPDLVLLILLAAPSAEINYTLASQMNGDADLAGATIVFTTLISAVSYLILLQILGIP